MSSNNFKNKTSRKSSVDKKQSKKTQKNITSNIKISNKSKPAPENEVVSPKTIDYSKS